jgi:type I restriction enzyme S subunit
MTMAKQGTSTALPRLRFPEFKERLPWEIKELSQLLATISNGLSLPQNSSGSGIKVTRIETIADGTIDLDRVGYVDVPEKDIEEYRLNIGDVLISNINSVAHIGKSVLIGTDQDLYHGMNLLRLRVDAKSNSPEFVYFSINTPSVRESFRERANKAVNQASINQTELGRTLIPAPSRLEQQKIADCLTSLDEVIAAQGQKVEALKAHKRGLMQQLFPREGETRPRLRFPEFHDAPDWIVGKASDIVEVLQGYGFPERLQGKREGEFPFYKVSDISACVDAGGIFLADAKNHIDAAVLEELRARLLPAGTTVFAKIGEAIRSNKRAIAARPCLVDNNAAGVKAIDGVAGDRFVYYLWSQIPLIEYAGGVVPSVNKSVIEQIEVCYPTIDEQQRIADCFASLDSEIVCETDRLSNFKLHKQGLMQQLFPNPVEY